MKWKFLLCLLCCCSFLSFVAKGDDVYSSPLLRVEKVGELQSFLESDAWQSQPAEAKAELFSLYCRMAKDADCLELLLQEGIAGMEDKEANFEAVACDPINDLYTNRHLPAASYLPLTKLFVEAGLPTKGAYLYRACTKALDGDRSLLDYWLERGSNINEGYARMTPLACLLLHNPHYHEQELECESEDPSAEALAEAKRKDAERNENLRACVLYLLAKGANVHGLLAGGEQPSSTPLSMASVYGNLDMMELLISLGADVNWADENGVTVLHHAIGFGVDQPTVDLLLRHGANLNAQSRGGLTPLICYLINNSCPDADVVQFFLNRGACADICTERSDLDGDGHVDVPALPTWAWCLVKPAFGDVEWRNAIQWDCFWLLFKAQSAAHICGYVLVLLVSLLLVFGFLYLLYRLLRSLLKGTLITNEAAL